MQTLKIVDNSKTKSMIIDIIALVRSQNSLSICAVGDVQINESISAIDKAKKLLKNEGIFLNTKPVLSERDTNSDEAKTTIVFQMAFTSLITGIAPLIKIAFTMQTLFVPLSVEIIGLTPMDYIAVEPLHKNQSDCQKTPHLKVCSLTVG